MRKELEQYSEYCKSLSDGYLNFVLTRNKYFSQRTFEYSKQKLLNSLECKTKYLLTNDEFQKYKDLKISNFFTKTSDDEIIYWCSFHDDYNNLTENEIKKIVFTTINNIVENHLNNNTTFQYTLVIYMKNNNNNRTSKMISNFSQKAFPDRVKKIYILPINKNLQKVVDLAKKVLPASIARKINLFSYDNAVLQLVKDFGYDTEDVTKYLNIIMNSTMSLETNAYLYQVK